MDSLLPNPLQAAGLLIWFIVVYALLKAWLFEPYLNALDQRFADTGGAADEFSKVKAQIASAEAGLKAKLDAARAQAQQAQDSILKAASENASAIISQAQATAQAEMNKAKIDASAAKKTVMDELEQAVIPLADHVVSKLSRASA